MGIISNLQRFEAEPQRRGGWRQQRAQSADVHQPTTNRSNPCVVGLNTRLARFRPTEHPNIRTSSRTTEHAQRGIL